MGVVVLPKIRNTITIIIRQSILIQKHTASVTESLLRPLAYLLTDPAGWPLKIKKMIIKTIFQFLGLYPKFLSQPQRSLKHAVCEKYTKYKSYLLLISSHFATS